MQKSSLAVNGTGIEVEEEKIKRSLIKSLKSWIRVTAFTSSVKNFLH